MRGYLLALTALGTAVLGLPLAGCGKGAETAQTAKAPAGPRLVLAASDTVNWQDVSAEIATVDQAQVLARIPGILTTITVKEGDMVAKGQVIGRIGMTGRATGPHLHWSIKWRDARLDPVLFTGPMR